MAAWSAKEGVEVLREGLQRLAGWRLKAVGGWRRPKTLVIDIDSLPVEVHGEQPGSAWNGYYHQRVYHPIVASAGETGDILDLRLREGQVHTADGGLEFVLEVLERIPSGEMSGEDLLALYRKRGKAEGHLGELMSVVAPALSSTARRKSHYRGKEIRKREKGVDPFACNQVRLLLAGFGYQIMHVPRAVLERMTGTGWTLRGLTERVLRTQARFTVSGRRITMTTGGASVHWHMLARGLTTLHGPSG